MMEQSEIDAGMPRYDSIMVRAHDSKLGKITEDEHDWLEVFNKERTKKAIVDLLIKHSTTMGAPETVTIPELVTYVRTFVMMDQRYYPWDFEPQMADLVKELEAEHQCRYYMQDGKVRIRRYTWW
jgi:hypothetical protein